MLSCIIPWHFFLTHYSNINIFYAELDELQFFKHSTHARSCYSFGWAMGNWRWTKYIHIYQLFLMHCQIFHLACWIIRFNGWKKLGGEICTWWWYKSMEKWATLAIDFIWFSLTSKMICTNYNIANFFISDGYLKA